MRFGYLKSSAMLEKTMLYALEGAIKAKGDRFAVLQVGGISFKVFLPKSSLADLPAAGSRAHFFCHLHVRDEAFELYGFLSEEELGFFESLISVSGVGPKSAISIMGVAKFDQLISAIQAGKADLLTRASGVGKKTAERIVLELKGSLKDKKGESSLTLLESDLDVEEALVGLGYTKAQAKAAIAKIPDGVRGFHDRLKAALKK